MPVLAVCILLVSLAGLTLGQTKMVLVDSHFRRVYRVDVNGESARYNSTRADLPGTNRFSIQDMSYDFVQDRIYYLDGHWTIKSVFVNGTGEQTVIADSNAIISALAVDPIERLMFLAIGRDIVKLGLDDSERSPILTTPSMLAALAVDYQNKRLYYDHYASNNVQWTDYSGETQETVGRTTFVGRSPHSVDFANNILYGCTGSDVCKFDLTGTGRAVDIGRARWGSETVYDPHTDRIFVIIPDRPIKIYKSDGTRVGQMKRFRGDDFILRFDPQFPRLFYSRSTWMKSIQRQRKSRERKYRKDEVKEPLTGRRMLPLA